MTLEGKGIEPDQVKSDDSLVLDFINDDRHALTPKLGRSGLLSAITGWQKSPTDLAVAAIIDRRYSWGLHTDSAAPRSLRPGTSKFIRRR